MRSHRLSLCAVVGILSLIFSSSVIAQVRIDVKTKWLEKKGLAAVKGGVIAAIDAAPSTSTAEFGEDYALWLKHLRRAKEGKDTVAVLLNLELRKPSLLNEGELIAAGTVVLRYSVRSLDSLRAAPGMTATITTQREKFDYWNRLIGTAVGGLLPKGGALIAPIVMALLEDVNAAPTPEEICEAVLIGARVAEWLEGRVLSDK